MDSIQINCDTKSIVKKIKETDLIPNEAVGVFIIKDCILIKIYTGKTFTYRVINFINGDVRHVKKLDESIFKKNDISF